MIPFTSQNALVTSPFYQEIIGKFNEVILKNGKLNKSKFYREEIAAKVPGYSRDSFYKFLGKFQKTAASALPAPINTPNETRLMENLRDSAEATRLGFLRHQPNVAEQSRRCPPVTVDHLAIDRKRAAHTFEAVH